MRETIFLWVSRFYGMLPEPSSHNLCPHSVLFQLLTQGFVFVHIGECVCVWTRMECECCLFGRGSKPDGKVWETAAVGDDIMNMHAHTHSLRTYTLV